MGQWESMWDTYPLGKKHASITYCTNEENKISKVFILFLDSNREERFQFKQTFEFSRVHHEIQPTKLTNHSAHANKLLSLYCSPS